MIRYRIINDDNMIILDGTYSASPEVFPAGTLYEIPEDSPAATHYQNGEWVIIIPEPPQQTEDELMAAIRVERDRRLASSDFTQLPDAPFSNEEKAVWAVYRQALRDFPDTCDPYNPVWPTPP